jgi:hypothetical protein
MKSPVEVRLLEALIPPPDFELACLVGTTYSLSPAVFLAIVSAASFDWNNRGGRVGFDVLTKEEWRALILEKRQNCLIFVDHHGAFEAGAGGLKPLEKVSLDQVIKKRGRDTDEGGSLHSKLIVALYKNSKNAVIGRVYVGSKNFTISQMQEFGVVYDLMQPPRQSGNRSFVESLVKYLEYLRDEEGTGTEARRLRPINQALELLRIGSLCVHDASCSLYWQGRQEDEKRTESLADQLQPLLKQRWKGVYVHSPWTRQSAVRLFADSMPDLPIRVACLKEPGLSTLKRPNVRYQLSYSATGHVQPHQSHAKIYLFSNDQHSVLVFGSANMTPDGWGLSVPGCRRNAEILVSTKVSAKDYRYLSDIKGRMEEVKASKFGHTVQEKVLALLNAIQVRVTFIREPAHLLYEIDQRGKLEGFKESVRIAHALIETPASETSGEIAISNTWPLPGKVEIPWEKSDLYRISSLIRISCPEHDVETHLIVDLDSDFYEGRARLSILQYKTNEIIESLAQLMDVVLPIEHIESTSSGGNNHNERLAALLDGMRVERYAYKMSRLKTREPTNYRMTIDRVTKVLAAGKADKSMSSDPRFMKLLQVVECIHGELSRA